MKDWSGVVGEIKPEQPVLDEIDELMAQACDEHGVPLDDYSKDRYVKCELCQQDWHGTLSRMGCPGAYATSDQRKTWVGKRCRTDNYIGIVHTEVNGQSYGVHLYLDRDSGGYVGLLMPEEAEQRCPGDLYTFDEARASFFAMPIVEGVQLPILEVPQVISPDAARHILGLEP